MRVSYGASPPQTWAKPTVSPPVRYYDRDLTEEEAVQWALALARWAAQTQPESPADWFSLTPYEQDALLRYNSVAQQTLALFLWKNGLVTTPPKEVVRRALGLWQGYGVGIAPGEALKGMGVIWAMAALVLFVAYKAK